MNILYYKYISQCCNIGLVVDTQLSHTASCAMCAEYVVQHQNNFVYFGSHYIFYSMMYIGKKGGTRCAYCLAPSNNLFNYIYLYLYYNNVLIYIDELWTVTHNTKMIFKLFTGKY